MHQCAARRLGHARAFEPVDAGGGAHVLIEDERIGEKLLDLFEAVEHFDETGVMVVERAFDWPRGQLLELGQFLVGQLRSHGFNDVEPRQGTYAISARGIAQRLVVDELGVTVVLDRFADHLGVPAGSDVILKDVALRVNQPQLAVGERDLLVLVDHSEVIRREIGENFGLRLEAGGNLLIGGQRHA